LITDTNVAPILKALAWPTATLILGLVFRSEIKDVFRRLRTAKLPGGTEASFGYGTAAVDKRSSEPNPPAAAVASAGIKGIKLSNSGNLFWLGHDLMWTADVVLRGAPLDVVLHGVRQSLKHARAMGFEGSSVESRLRQLHDHVDGSDSSDWTAERRNQVASDINRVIATVGDVAVAGQPDFREVTE
jgi:hypothetical protein